jgi:hypothetical protein
VRRLALVVALAGCNPVYAPPLRGTQYGVPGRLDGDHHEVNLTSGGVYSPPLVVNPSAGFAINRWVAIELGGNLAVVGDKFALGWVGPRFTWQPRRGNKVRFVADLESGVGAGVGGVDDSCVGPHACPNAFGRLAYGGYQGFGFGFRAGWFGLAIRARLEETITDGIPLTLWPSVSGHIETAIGRNVALYSGGGYIGYYNRISMFAGFFYQFGMAVLFSRR